jgi:hypothetical protein
MEACRFGQSVPPLVSGDKLALEYPNNDRKTGQVIEAAGHEATIERRTLANQTDHRCRQRHTTGPFHDEDRELDCASLAFKW